MAVQSKQRLEMWTHLRSPRISNWELLDRQSPSKRQHSDNRQSEAAFKNRHSKKQKWFLETSSKNSPPQNKIIFMNPNSSSNHRWKKKQPSQQVQDTLSFSISRSFFCKALTLRRKASASPGSTGGRRRSAPAWRRGQLMLGQTPKTPNQTTFRLA